MINKKTKAHELWFFYTQILISLLYEKAYYYQWSQY